MSAAPVPPFFSCLWCLTESFSHLLLVPCPEWCSAPPPTRPTAIGDATAVVGASVHWLASPCPMPRSRAGARYTPRARLYLCRRHPHCRGSQPAHRQAAAEPLRTCQLCCGIHLGIARVSASPSARVDAVQGAQLFNRGTRSGFAPLPARRRIDLLRQTPCAAAWCIGRLPPKKEAPRVARMWRPPTRHRPHGDAAAHK